MNELYVNDRGVFETQSSLSSPALISTIPSAFPLDISRAMSPVTPCAPSTVVAAASGLGPSLVSSSVK
jgi:hypothetical protein